MFAGVISLTSAFFPGAFADSANLIAALGSHEQAAKNWVWQDEYFLLVQANTQNRDPNSIPYRCPHSGRLAVFWGRLDNRNELLRELQLPEDVPDAALALAAWHKRREECPACLVGDFAFVLFDPQEQKLFLARDPLGVRPLYYLASEDFFAFGCTAAVFPRLQSHAPAPDPQWIAAYLANLSHSHDRTAYKGVLKLPPGHSLELHRGRTSLRRYFEFRDDAPETRKRDHAWVEAYRAILQEAVLCRLDAQRPMGFDNSGGMDSSTVVGCAVQLTRQPLANLHGFGYAFDELEPGYMMETSRYCGMVNNHLITQLQIPDEDILERALRMNGYPLEWHNGQASPMYFYRWAEQFGIGRYFSGFGGDECGTSQAHQARYEFLANRQFCALWDALPGNPARRALAFAKAVKNHFRLPQGSSAMGAAYARYRQLWILRPEFEQELRPLHEEEARFNAPYRRVNDFILQNRLGPRLTTRLENSTMMCQAYGIEYCAPLLDVRLVQQYLSTPSLEKVGNGMGRYLHRRAIEGIVPPKIQWNRRKDMGDWGFRNGWRSENMKHLARLGAEEAANMHPAVAELVDKEKLSRQIDNARDGLDEQNFCFMFTRNILSLRWLNRWLYRR
ncbi:MAG: asparagine synthetase B family protein [Actinomycetota bacterium]